MGERAAGNRMSIDPPPKPRFIRSDNGPEFTSKEVIKWLTHHRIGPAFIKPGSPWQNGLVESFNRKFRDECLSREWFLNRKDAQRIIIERWRKFYDHDRPHSSRSSPTHSVNYSPLPPEINQSKL